MYVGLLAIISKYNVGPIYTRYVSYHYDVIFGFRIFSSSFNTLCRTNFTQWFFKSLDNNDMVNYPGYTLNKMAAREGVYS